MAEGANNKVFLFFGTTGTEKKEALSRLASWAQAQGRTEPLQIDFEDRIEELYGPGLLYQYLDQSNVSHQRRDWRDVFDRVSSEVEQERQWRDVYVAMHGALIRKDYGVRSAIAFEKVALLKPDAIVTLIDDVFINWHHTEQRVATGQYQKGRPTLSQLLIGRRHEILISDLIVNFLEDKFGRPHRPHYVLALRHSVETLGRLLYSKNPKRVYVSFPISTARKRQQQGDSKAMSQVNGLLQEALEFQKRRKNLVLFLPVTMDEMLIKDLADATSSEPAEGDTVELTLSRRWPIPKVLGPTLRNEVTLPMSIKLPAQQVMTIAGLIHDEIRTHDFRMIDQSQKVLVLSQYCEKERSTGVSAEISYAVTSLTKVEAYQVPDWVPDGMEWRPPSGTGPFAGGRVRPEYEGYHTRLQDALRASIDK